MQGKYRIRQALPEDEKEVLKIARKVTDKFTRTYLGDKAVDWYINSGCCDNDIKNDISNMLLLIEDEKIIGMMIWHGDLMHLLMIDSLYHGTGAANSFYKKTGWIEYDKIPEEMTGGNRVSYMMIG